MYKKKRTKKILIENAITKTRKKYIPSDPKCGTKPPCSEINKINKNQN